MALPSPIELIIDRLESDARKYVGQYASECKPPFPTMSLNGTCEEYGYTIDDITTNLLQKYITTVQKSSERKYSDPRFNEIVYSKKLNTIQSIFYKSATVITSATTAVGAYFLACNVIDPNFPNTALMFGFFGGATGLLMGRPLGDLLMKIYGKSRFLGTRKYDENSKEITKRKIIKHIRKTNPEDRIIKYDAELHKRVESTLRQPSKSGAD